MTRFFIVTVFWLFSNFFYSLFAAPLIPKSTELPIVYSKYVGLGTHRSTLLALNDRVVIPSMGLRMGAMLDGSNGLYFLTVSASYKLQDMVTQRQDIGDIESVTFHGHFYGFVDGLNGLGVADQLGQLIYYNRPSINLVPMVHSFDGTGDGLPELLVLYETGMIHLHSLPSMDIVWAQSVQAKDVATFQSSVPILAASAAIVDLTGDGVRDVLVATLEGQLIALNGRSGRRLWVKDLPGSFNLPPRFSGTAIYALNENGVLFELTFSGELRNSWIVDPDQVAYQAPVIVNRLVFIHSEPTAGSEMILYDLDQSEPLDLSFGPTIGTMMVKDFSGQLRAIVIGTDGTWHEVKSDGTGVAYPNTTGPLATLPVLVDLNRNGTNDIVYVDPNGTLIVHETPLRFRPIYAGPHGNPFHTGGYSDPLSFFPRVYNGFSQKVDTGISRESEHSIYRLNAIGSPEYLVTASSIGHAQLGMPFGLFQRRLPAPYSLVGPLQLDNHQIVQISIESDVHYELIFPSKMPVSDTSPITHIRTQHPKYRTAEGVGPRQLLQHAVPHYGAPKFTYFSNIGTEWIHFDSFGSSLRVELDMPKAGQYTGKSSVKISRSFNPNARIKRIVVSGINR